jgi:DUF1680 family protein
MEKLVRKLGSEKLKHFIASFDEVVDKYEAKAKEDGYLGKLKFTKEKGKVVVFVELEE